MHRQTAGIGLLLALLCIAGCNRPAMIVDRDVAVTMRDGTVLRADVYRPPTERPVPVLLYRTPYGKHYAAESYTTHLSAVRRGYAVVLQDVRGRYASDGDFDPYRNEGRDGFDSIEWAAAQPWSNGSVGTFGLSYPGAVQWLAAVESPPALKAMVPAMTFSSPRNFFYMNGVFDLSWLPWIYFNIAPHERVRQGADQLQSDAEVAAAWARDGARILAHLPLRELPDLRDVAPYYYEWLSHPPDDDWWSWAEIRGRYRQTDAAVLNISGWYDEAYGPEGAATNFAGLVAARQDQPARTELILGPWQHGVHAIGESHLGALDFGPDAALDYDELLLQFFDRHLAGKNEDGATLPPVRYWVMGANEWRYANAFPPPGARPVTLCLQQPATLGACDPAAAPSAMTFTANPADPVVDPHGTFAPNDYQSLAARDDVLVFETPPLQAATTIAGYTNAKLFVSCNCPDFDLWVRLLDVYPDGRAINLMSPGSDVQRLSFRDEPGGRSLLTPGEIYAVDLDSLITANRFDAGHRIRIQLSASFSPHLSRNLQTGALETGSAESMPAEITVHLGGEHASALVLPVTP